jgi:sugar porter (SP) family MFS transporter
MQHDLQRRDSVPSITMDPDSKAIDEQHENKLETAPAYALVYQKLSFKATIRVFWKSMLFAVGVSTGAIFDCYGLMVPNQIVGNIGFIEQFGDVRNADGQVVALNPQTLSNWSTAALACTVAGLGIGAYVGDRFGRKAALYVMLVVMMAAAVLSVTASTQAAWTARAALGGAAQGLLQSSAIPYLSEIAPTKIRGMCLNLYVFFWSVGILSGSVGLYIAEGIDKYNFRLSFYGQFVFAAVFIPSLVFAPESPWWYARRGREVDAKRSLTRLYGNVASYDVDVEYTLMMNSIQEEQASVQAQSGGQPEWKLYLDCFRGVNLRRTFVSMIPISTQAFSGVVLFYGYTVYFFQQAGYDKPFEANLIFGCLQLVGTASSFFLLDLVGRRPLLIFGSGVCALCCWGLGGLAFAAEPSGKGMVALCCIWISVYSATLNSLGYTFVGEISTQRLKSKTSAISFGVYACLSLIMAYICPYMLSDLEWGWGLKTGKYLILPGGSIS